MVTRSDVEASAGRVLSRIKAMVDLPPHGTVGGQGVASLFYEELGLPFRGPINDIDVFVNVGLPRHLRGRPDTPKVNGKLIKSGGLVRRWSESIESDYRHTMRFMAVRSDIEMMSSYREGLVNYTLINKRGKVFGSVVQDNFLSQQIVDGFDLNLVGVGINIHNGKAVCSNGFLEFLNSGRIRAQTSYTPAHTMIRLAKKWFGGEISGAVCDYDAERRMLELALVGIRPESELGVSAPKEYVFFSGVSRFGKRVLEKAEPFKSHLPEVVLDGPGGGLFSFGNIILSENDRKLAYLQRGLNGPQISDDSREIEGQDVYVGSFARLSGEGFSLIYDAFRPGVRHGPRRGDLKEALEGLFVDDVYRVSESLDEIMGRPILKEDEWPVRDIDPCTFFDGQGCASIPELASKAVECLRQMSPEDADLISRREGRADAVLLLSEDRRAGLLNLIGDGLDTIFGSAASASDELREEIFWHIHAELGNLDGSSDRLAWMRQFLRYICPKGSYPSFSAWSDPAVRGERGWALFDQCFLNATPYELSQCRAVLHDLPESPESIKLKAAVGIIGCSGVVPAWFVSAINGKDADIIIDFMEDIIGARAVSPWPPKQRDRAGALCKIKSIAELADLPVLMADNFRLAIMASRDGSMPGSVREKLLSMSDADFRRMESAVAMVNSSTDVEAHVFESNHTVIVRANKLVTDKPDSLRVLPGDYTVYTSEINGLVACFDEMTLARAAAVQRSDAGSRAPKM